MAGRFSAQMSSQSAGCPAAIRVMSRKPPAARRSRAACSSARSSARVISAAAARWGTWLTTATRASWRSGGSATTSAPRSDTTRATAANVVSAVAAVGVSTQTAPSNMAASAPSRPSSSEPAIGWPPQKRSSATAAATGAFTLPTSVTSPLVAARACLAGVGDRRGRGGDEGDRRVRVEPAGVDGTHADAPPRRGPGRRRRRAPSIPWPRAPGRRSRR